jgi:hypothetical protein
VRERRVDRQQQVPRGGRALVGREVRQVFRTTTWVGAAAWLAAKVVDAFAWLLGAMRRSMSTVRATALASVPTAPSRRSPSSRTCMGTLRRSPWICW